MPLSAGRGQARRAAAGAWLFGVTGGRADLGDGLALMSRRFPPPWTVEETNVRGSASIGN